jgi:DNA modification methylase
MADNTLYYGDNLDILKRHIRDESVDLVYLDPPFNSNQDYNVLFKERDGARSGAQVKAFKDTWMWDQEASRAYHEMVEHGPEDVSKALRAFHTFLGQNDMLAYLSMMAPRLVDLRRVLKDTGSIYLHCDPTASHYLKMLMDAVFGPVNFRNEIIWKRTHAHGSSRRYGPLHDSILFYSKTDQFLWTDLRLGHNPAYIEKHFTFTDPVSGRLFQPISLTGAGRRTGDSGRPWRDIDPTAVGRHWALPGELLHELGVDESASTQQKLDALDAAAMIYWPRKAGGTPRLKSFADRLEGTAAPDLWTDIPPIPAQAAERLGYPTQKPEVLLERIIKASSNEGDMVLDPFCGCGTTVAVAQRLNRRWIGIDVTCLAINLMRRRLEAAFGGKAEFDVIGEPTAYSEAKQLAAENPYQFQWWALDLVGARPVIEKKGADKGVDGRLIFHDDTSGEAKQVILQVKAGHVAASHIRDLRGVIEREGAQIGCLICLEEPTQPMRSEAADAGFYQHPLGTGMYPRIQILTIKELLEGRKLQLPEGRIDVTFKKAQRAKTKQRALGDADTP